MTKDEMRKGFALGRTLTQEEWSSEEEVRAADQLIAEGVATATAWKWHDNFQCQRRHITGIAKSL